VVVIGRGCGGCISRLRLSVFFFFFGSLCSMKLPTNDALNVKHVRCDPLCSLCGVDNETVVHLFMRFGAFGAIVHEIRGLLKQLHRVQFQFVKREEGNMLVHTLAKIAFCNDTEERREYFDYIPRFLSGVIYKDIMLE